MTGISNAANNGTIIKPQASATGQTQNQPVNRQNTPAPKTEPADQFKPGEAGPRPVDKAQIQGHLNEVKEKDKIVDGMLVRNGSMTDGEAKDIKDNLSVIDIDTLKFAKKNDLKFQVVKPGESLIDKGVVSPRGMDQVQQKAGEYAKTGDKILGDVNPQYHDKIAAARKEEQKIAEESLKNPMGQAGMGGGFNMNDVLSGKADFTPKSDKLDGERRKNIGERLEKETKGDVMLYDPTAMMAGHQGLGGMGLGNIGFLQSKMPSSTSQMAAVHGARTPEEIKQFNQTVEQLNGDRLQNARQESLQYLEKGRNNPGVDKDMSDKMLARFKEHPEEIPIDHSKHDLLVPNRFQYRANDPGLMQDPNNPDKTPLSKPTTVNYHDYQTLKDWHNKDGVLPSNEDAKKSNFMVQGQYFKDKNLIILRGDESITKDKNIAVHEFGHGVDNMLKNQKPEFHSQWRKDVTSAYDATKGEQDKWISGYSRTNEGEYIAEGFAAYHTRGKVLKTMDPTLSNIIKRMDETAQTEGRQ